MGGIAGRGHRQPLFLQPVSGEGPRPRVQARADRYAQEHASNAPQPAAHQDGHNDPEPGYTRAVSQNPRAQNIAVKLLEGQDEEDEVQALDGAVQQDQKRTGNGPQEGTEEGNDVGDPHHHADQRGVGKFKEAGKEKAQDSDN